jgi:hypothetical protein
LLCAATINLDTLFSTALIRTLALPLEDAIHLHQVLLCEAATTQKVLSSAAMIPHLTLQALVNRNSKFLYPMWMHPGRICRFSEGDNKSLLKVTERENSGERLRWGVVDIPSSNELPQKRTIRRPQKAPMGSHNQ